MVRAFGAMAAAGPVLILLLSLWPAPPAEAQAQRFLQEGEAALDRSDGTAEAAAIPEELSPEVIDAMLARLTDTEIRALLRGELVRRAEEQAAETEEGMSTLDAIAMRLSNMATTIETRVRRWAGSLADIPARRAGVADRLAEAERGVGAMLWAAAGLVLAGVAAALLVGWLTRPWRQWLVSPQRGHYWDRVVRTLALGLVELMPIVALVAATRLLAPMLSGALGPLTGQVWIYHAGVSYAWAFIVLTRRAFAPDAPQIRIASLTDPAAGAVHKLLRRAVLIGLAGWLLAGLLLNLGVGFAAAIPTVALAGTAVSVLLFWAIARNAVRIRAAVENALIQPNRQPSAFARISVVAAPFLLAFYVFAAGGYWVANWLETGRHHLAGPAGTLVVFFCLPIVDRLGEAICLSLVRADTARAGRFRKVLHEAGRIVIGIVAVFVVARLWGLDLLEVAKGEGAVAWASPVFDIAVTLLIGHLIWRIVRAVLHTERRVSTASEDVDPSEIPAASRLDTLMPLFRNALLVFLSLVMAMIVLSSVGVDIGPLLASAGIIGIAVGFGAQTLVRDIFSGVFFLIDDAFRVGEYIELDTDLRGEVEAISVRSLQLRHHRGPVITIPFGELKQITNHNRDWVIYKMPFRLEPETDPQHVKRVVKEVGKEFLAHPEHGSKFIEPLKSQGVYYIDDDSALVIRVKFKCRPRAQFVLRREIYHRLREVFAKEGIRLARRKVEVVGPDGEDVPDTLAQAGLPDEVVGPATPAAIG
ncbi:MAG: mechanosensitive ion channel family protein [Pseudomonadota bacterium]